MNIIINVNVVNDGAKDNLHYGVAYFPPVFAKACSESKETTIGALGGPARSNVVMSYPGYFYK